MLANSEEFKGRLILTLYNLFSRFYKLAIRILLWVKLDT